MQRVNIAGPDWGTQISATTVFSQKYSPENLADGSVEGPGNWFGQDGAPLPQHVLFQFAQPERITGIKVVQAQWMGHEYRCKAFDVELSSDGHSWTPLATGALAVDTGSEWEKAFDPVETQWLRIVITDSYDDYRTCGLAEVEIYGEKPAGATPPYAGAAREFQWDAFGRMVRMQLQTDPPARFWIPEAGGSESQQVWHSGPYRFELNVAERGPRARVYRYALARTDGQPFRVVETRLEVKSSFAGVYKIFTPSTMAQQNYRIDLPFRIEGGCRAEVESPVIWMQETSGDNTLTVGMLDQVPMTRMDGSTYDPSNGGEAPGIANSYARVGFTRHPQMQEPVPVFRDGFYVNADPAFTWHEALTDYAAAVDAWREFAPRPVGRHALRSMWHSWYAHADQIDQAQLLDDAEHAAALGVQTLEIDAGWNVPPGVGYSFDVEGDYEFDPQRFPDPIAMVDRMHALDLAVILHVAPLLMGPQAKAYAEMKDCILSVDGKASAYLDPRLKKTHDYLLAAWERLMLHYKMDGFWYDFLELADDADPPAAGMEVVSPNLHEAYTLLMQRLHDKALSLNPDTVIILRRGSANLNAKTYATHVWPMDTPQDYNMNRRDIVYLKTFGAGVATHACCTSWPISESDENVARQMASIALAGVPAFSVKLAESPESHNAIIRAWLEFYHAHQEELVLGVMTPLLPTPPSAALRIEGDHTAFFGFFEATPGLVQVTKPSRKIVLVNAFSDRLVTRVEGLTGEFKMSVFDQAWKPISKGVAKSDGTGVNLDVSAPTRCFAVVLEGP